MDEASLTGRRVAFFGGSFDPPHRGHLAVARAAQAALGLDSVLFAPVGTQPLKPHGSTAPFPDRLAMTRLAIAGDPAFSISLADAPSASPNYTIDTLAQIKAELPAGCSLFCLMGADSFLTLRQWRRGAEIPFAAPLIVASRPGQDLDQLAAILPGGLLVDPGPPVLAAPSGVELRTYTLRNPCGQTVPFHLLPGLEIEISASDIRSQVHAVLGESHSGPALLPKAVLDYIAAHNLYL